MDKYTNYIYLTICEVSLGLSEASFFTTYKSYCDVMNKSLGEYDGYSKTTDDTEKEYKLNSRETKDILVILRVLDNIFGLKYVLGLEYVIDYFKSGRCLEFERSVRLTRDVTEHNERFNIKI